MTLLTPYRDLSLTLILGILSLSTPHSTKESAKALTRSTNHLARQTFGYG